MKTNWLTTIQGLIEWTEKSQVLSVLYSFFDTKLQKVIKGKVMFVFQIERKTSLLLKSWYKASP